MKKLTTSTNETERVGTATERTKNSQKSSQHGQNSRRQRSRKWDNEEDLSTTKDLSTRGMEDPCMSQEASVEGNSTGHTSVLCAAMLHEMPNQPQNSLQVTQRRLPIEDEPCTCEQEVVESVVTARHTKGIAQLANPPEMDANADRTTLLGREPAERPVESTRVTGQSAEICGSNKHIFTAKKMISATKMQTRMYLLQMDCRSRGSGQHIQAVR